jgi:CheY-like chemotaxis protein
MILDLFMPIMNGFDALFILRQEYPDAKVIAVSGGGSTMGSDALQEAAELGAQMTLQKPIMPTALIEAVSRLLVA